MNIVIEENENVYRKARNKAATRDKNFKSREKASEFLGIGKDQLYNYETGLCKNIPTDVIVKMADIYNSPELLNYYCCNSCPIGKLTVPRVSKENINNIYKLSINIFNLLGLGNDMGKKLLDVVEDGEITEDEKPTIDYIVDNLKKLSGFTNDLVIALEKL